MDSFELNKIIAAVLLTALIIIGIGKFTDVYSMLKNLKSQLIKLKV
jgi:hypothetical protein